MSNKNTLKKWMEFKAIGKHYAFTPNIINNIFKPSKGFKYFFTTLLCYSKCHFKLSSLHSVVPRLVIFTLKHTAKLFSHTSTHTHTHSYTASKQQIFITWNVFCKISVYRAAIIYVGAV